MVIFIPFYVSFVTFVAARGVFVANLVSGLCFHRTETHNILTDFKMSVQFPFSLNEKLCLFYMYGKGSLLFNIS